jgi:ribonuclease HII
LEEPSSSFSHSHESKRLDNQISASQEASLTADLWEIELRFLALGFKRIAGVDEAGRGPLAGPVVAACIILPSSFDTTGVNDSKRLTLQQREAVFGRLQCSKAAFAIGVVDSLDIDRINILKATHLAMRRAVAGLPHTPDLLLIDGLPVPSLAACDHHTIVKGDSLSASIAAASIIAKVMRDRLMVQYDGLYPEYGFRKHKGYGSAEHLAALQTHGPCPIHRRSFGPVGSTVGPKLL